MFRIKQIILSNFQILILITAILVVLLSTLPYFNLVLSEQVALLFFFILLSLLLKIRLRFFLFALIFIIFSIALLLFSQNELAEKFGNYIYFFLLLGFTQIVFNFPRD